MIKGNDKQAGFSMIELLVVVAIMGILAVIAVPQMSNFMRNFRVTQSTNAVLGVLRTARANAIKEFREVRAYVDLDEEKIKFKICDGPGDCGSDPDLDWVDYSSEMSTLKIMDGVDLYGVRHAIDHDGGNATFHWATSNIHPIEFLATGTKRFEALVLTYKPNPGTGTDAACEYRTIYMGSTGQPRMVRSSDNSHSDKSYGAYKNSSPSGSSALDHNFSTVPSCAQ